MSGVRYFACISLAGVAAASVGSRIYTLGVYFALWCLVLAIDSVAEAILAEMRKRQ